MNNNYSFILTGGGTGGHLIIAKTLAQSIKKSGYKVTFIGSTSGQDREWFEGNTLFDKTLFLKTTGVVNQKGLKKLFALWRIFNAYLTSLKVVKSADAVISVGGFSAAPASFAAVTLKKPFFIHEQNATMGKLNTLLKPYTTALFSSYESSALIKDYPVNQKLFDTKRIRKEIKTIIFLGGSQGATFINELALQLAPYLQKKGIHIIHQCGKLDYEKVRDFYKKNNIDAEYFAFSKELYHYIEKADFAISRAGASTLWELCANALPTFFIPYPYAANDHQSANAAFLVEKNLAWCEKQNDAIYEHILKLLDEDLESKSSALSTIIAPNGAQKIVNAIITQLNKDLNAR